MPVISLAAEASVKITRRIAEGSLRIDGIVLRDAKGPFRYILRGFENLPKDASQLSALSALEPLRAAMTLQQILQVVSIAQNAAVAASLRRIERRLKDIENRLGDIEHRLSKVESKTSLILEAVRSSPVNRLQGAKTAAAIGSRTATRQP